MKELLTDCMTFDFNRDQMFTESINDSSKRLLIKGILQRANVKNQNGRIYPKDILVREAKKYEEEFIKERRAMGELDHPSSEVVNLQNVSHNIIEIHWDGDDLLGTIEVLTTPNGNILRELLKANIRVGISSRGMGTINKNIKESADVVDDFSLIGFDIVSNPSTRGAFMFPSGTISENVDVNVSKNDKWESVENIIRDIISEINYIK